MCCFPQEWRARSLDWKRTSGAFRSIPESSAARRAYSGSMPDWDELHARARARYEDGEARLPDAPDERQRQLTRMGNAAGAAGLSALMAHRDGTEWFFRAAERYRESWEHAPPGSWGRPIGAIKSRIL